jgi:hypothetical protein
MSVPHLEKIVKVQHVCVEWIQKLFPRKHGFKMCVHKALLPWLQVVLEGEVYTSSANKDCQSIALTRKRVLQATKRCIHV